MRLYLVRHGIAEELVDGMADADRRLTHEGIARVRDVARGMARLGVAPDRIVSSPLPRVLETAEIVAEALGPHRGVRQDARLAGPFGLGDLADLVGEEPHVSSWMLVGHEPTCGRLAGQLPGGSAMEVKKGGLILVEFDRVEPGTGCLRWLLPPSVLVAVGQ